MTTPTIRATRRSRSTSTANCSRATKHTYRCSIPPFCFLIRDPEAVVTSFTTRRPDAAVLELGFEQQARIFDHVCDTLGTPPPVLDASDVLQDPRGMLSGLCAKLGIRFSARMLHWARGSRSSDGVWAPYWYAAVQHSTGFAPYVPRVAKLTTFQQKLIAVCRPYYARLARYRLVRNR